MNCVSNFWDSPFRAAFLAITDGEPLINTKNCFHIGWISVLLPIAHLQNLFCNTGNVQRHCQVGKGMIHAEIITFHAGDTHLAPILMPTSCLDWRGQMGSVKGFGTTTSTCYWQQTATVTPETWVSRVALWQSDTLICFFEHSGSQWDLPVLPLASSVVSLISTCQINRVYNTQLFWWVS